MAKVTWLHISDIHFHPTSEWHASPAREALLTYLTKIWAETPALLPDFIVCTGDIAFGETSASPLAEQYQAAKLFFDQLLNCCQRDQLPLAKDRLFVVPGNHDINRRKVNSYIQTALKSDTTKQHKINDDFAKLNKDAMDILQSLADYNQFVEQYLPHQHDPNGRACYAQTIPINGIEVGIYGFNSAWSSGGAEDDRHLWLAAQWQFSQAKAALADSTVRIGLIHHPVDWLTAVEREVAKVRFEQEFDFLLHGHNHDSWCNSGQQLITIGAGAIGAHHSEEFGINLNQLDLTTGTGTSHWHTFSTSAADWHIKVIANQAPQGQWQYTLPAAVLAKTAPAPQPPQPSPADAPIAAENRRVLVNSATMFGREKLLKEGQQKLSQNHCLMVYGLRGNGKSMFINGLGQQPPLDQQTQLRIAIQTTTTATTLYQQLARALGDRDENPIAPPGTELQIISALNDKLSDSEAFQGGHPHWVWLEDAHQLFADDQFKDTAIRALLLALMSLLPHWHWLFELRERPSKGLIRQSQEIEVPGLDKKTLGDFLRAHTPDNAEPWAYQGDKLKGIFQWLGGGHGHQAHALASRLLVEVAKGSNSNPYVVLQNQAGDVEQKIEQKLLKNLYYEVLNPQEQQLLACLALYRVDIPNGHIEQLEQQMTLGNAFDGLDLRCLLTADSHFNHFYLHGLISSWLRHLQGYPGEDVDYIEHTPQLDLATDVLERQRHIAQCWQADIKGKRRIRQNNLYYANEALFHLVSIADPQMFEQVTLEMLGGTSDDIYRRLEKLDDYLRHEQQPLAKRRQVLTLMLKLRPDETKLHRFLGSCWRSEFGWGDSRALASFKQAVALEPDRPEVWANYGRACLAQQQAATFLQQLDHYQQNTPNPAGINDYVLNIQMKCLEACDNIGQAMAQRQQLIDDGSKNPVVFADQAKAYINQDEPALALEVLAIADKRRIGNDFTLNIKAQALSQAGHTDQAMALRQQLIDGGNENPVVFADQAHAYLNQGQPALALKVLAIADKRGIGNDFTLNIKAQALSHAGQTDQAMALRQQLIDDGSKNPVVFADQAHAYLNQGQPALALEVLAIADKLGIGNDFTLTIKAQALSQAGHTDQAMTLRQQLIDADSKDPVVFADQAHAYLNQNQPALALKVLAIADKRGIGNDFTLNIKAQALSHAGHTDQAMALRQQSIKDGSKNPVVFNDQAHAYINQGEPALALKVLAIAERRRATDGYTHTIKTTALRLLPK